jgi:steroid 5-alpha reductase family enzyme
MGDFLRLSVSCLVGLALLQAVTCAISVRVDRFRVVDRVWGIGLAGVAILAAFLGTEDLPRRVLLAALITAWGLRLSVHITRRSWRAPEDPRYAELIAGDSTARACVKVFALQGLAQWFITLPVQVSAVTGPPTGPGWALVGFGTALMLTGLLVETIADRQLAAFTADPARHGRVMDQGLWAWSRHPNYFGDATFWVGVYLVAAAVWPGALTLASAAAMVWFLVVATGARRLERDLAVRPGYRAYQQRTRFFVPRPPRTTPSRDTGHQETHDR